MSSVMHRIEKETADKQETKDKADKQETKDKTCSQQTHKVLSL